MEETKQRHAQEPRSEPPVQSSGAQAAVNTSTAHTDAKQVVPPKSQSRSLRIALATTCAVISLTISSWAAVYKIQKIDPFVATGVLPFNEASKAAIDLRLSQSGDFLKVCIVFLGGLAALVVAKRDEARIGFADHPETIMFICASLALIASWIWHEFYLNKLSQYLLVGARTCFDNTEKCVPDVFNGPLEYLYWFQVSFLVLGAAQAGITLVSAHRLKED